MKRYVLILLIIAAIAVAIAIVFLGQDVRTGARQKAAKSTPGQTNVVQKAQDSVEMPADAIVFDMKYRGLSGAKDKLRYNSYYGFGGSGAEDSSFIRSLKKEIKRLHVVYNPNLGRAQYSAVEIEGRRAVAFYFDLNADGKFSDDEKLKPIARPEARSSRRTEFVTPDFTIRTSDGRKVPFRVLLRVAFYGSSSRPSCMWSPSCILEGTSELNGEPTKLILFADGFSGSFTEYGRCGFSLLPADEQIGRYVSRDRLSSLINHKRQFYHLKLQGSNEKDSSVRVMLTKDKSPAGELALALAGSEDLKARLSSAGITGSKDKTVSFDISGGQTTLPVGTYKLDRGYIYYGADSDDQWRVNFREGPEFTIEANEPCHIKLGEPKLSVSAVDYTKRYNSDAEEKSVFPKGTRVYITPKVKGKAGEVYRRFSRRTNGAGRYGDSEPWVKIVDPDGKETASAKLEYG